MTRARTWTLADDPLGGTVRRTVLPNGLRILTEAVPAMRSVSFGIWVGVGSRDETRQLSGVSHFLEHLLFKGTQRRTALEISAAIEAVGGETNAFTTKEYTCYYARVLDADLPLAIDVMCDLVIDSVLAESDVETERGVILEEIAMHDDEPGDEVHDLFAEALYGDHPLGRLISGTVETISPMTPPADPDLLPAPLRRAVHCGRGGRQPRPRAGGRAGPGGVRPPRLGSTRGRADAAARLARAGAAAPARAAGCGCATRTPNRRTSCSAAPALARDDERRFALGVLNNAARRRHVVAPVPGDPRAAWPGLLGLLLHLAVRRLRRASASTPAAPRARSTRSWR